MSQLNNIESHQESNKRLDVACMATNEIVLSGMNGIKRVILFGSTVRAQANRYSDIDLALIADSKDDRNMDPDLRRRGIRVDMLLNKAGILSGSRPMGVNVSCWWDYEYEAFSRMREINDPLADVISQGITLYQSLSTKPTITSAEKL